MSPHTTRSYLDALQQTFMVRVLQPWHENLGKRLVKSPKIYLRDCGLFHALQGIQDRACGNSPAPQFCREPSGARTRRSAAE